MSTFNLNKISQHRQELMGFSAILILICHAVGNGVKMPTVLSILLNFGNIVVDIFLFLSGMGLLYSLQSKGGGKNWYSRRYKRILIPYMLIAVPFYTIKVVIGDSGILDALYDLSTISYWTHHRSAWFMALLMPLYAITPLLSKIIDGAKKRWIPALVLCVVCIVVAVSLKGLGDGWSQNVSAAVQRVPSFITGYWMGKLIKDEIEVKSWVLFVVPVVVFALLFVSPIKIYCFWLLMFPMIVCLLWILEGRSKGKRCFVAICMFMGTITLESYLTNGYMATLLKHVNWTIGGIDLNYGNYAFYAAVLVVGLLWAVEAHRLSERILKPKNVNIS